MVTHIPFSPALRSLSEKKNLFFMAKHSYTLSDKVLYDDASLYIAKEGEKLYFNFKKELVETYNVLEAVAILINKNKYCDLPIWKIKIDDADKQIDCITTVFYWLCHTLDIEENLKIEWSTYCDHITEKNKPYISRILHEAETLGDIKNGIIKDLNFDKMYSQLLHFIV
jgi:hypothetical protein